MTGTGNKWTPLLSGSEYQSAQACIGITIATLYDEACAREQAGELCDAALLYGYVAKEAHDSDLGNTAAQCLNLAAKAENGFSHFGIKHGLSELAWVIQHLARLDGDESPDEESEPAAASFLDTFDALLVNKLQSGVGGISFGLNTGLVGLGVYFLERLPRPAAQRGLLAVLDQLAATAESTPDGVTWSVDHNALEPGLSLGRSPIYCPGLSEGVAGVIHFLGELWAAGIEQTRCEQLLERVTCWLFQQPAPEDGRLRFGRLIQDGVVASASRLAWCHGDLGIAMSLLQAGNRLGNSSWCSYCICVAR